MSTNLDPWTGGTLDAMKAEQIEREWYAHPRPSRRDKLVEVIDVLREALARLSGGRAV